MRKMIIKKSISITLFFIFFFVFFLIFAFSSPKTISASTVVSTQKSLEDAINNPEITEITIPNSVTIVIDAKLDIALAVNSNSRELKISGGTLKRADGFFDHLISVNSGVLLTLEDLVIDGSQVNATNSAVYSLGSLIINNSRIINNHITSSILDPLGYGAINSRYSLVVNNTSFINNHSSYGGAIYFQGAALIENSVFQDNFVSELGEIIYGSNVTSIEINKITANSTNQNENFTSIYIEGTTPIKMDGNSYISSGINLNDNQIIKLTSELTHPIYVNLANPNINDMFIEGLDYQIKMSDAKKVFIARDLDDPSSFYKSVLLNSHIAVGVYNDEDYLLDVYVSNSGDDLTGDGSSLNPFSTLYEALAHIDKNGTIHIQGQYDINQDIFIEHPERYFSSVAINLVDAKLIVNNGSLHMSGTTITIEDTQSRLDEYIFVDKNASFTIGKDIILNNILISETPNDSYDLRNGNNIDDIILPNLWSFTNTSINQDYYQSNCRFGNQLLIVYEIKINWSSNSVIALEIIQMPDKLEYVAYDEIDLSGLIIGKIYADDTIDEITTFDDFEISYMKDEFISFTDTHVTLIYQDISIDIPLVSVQKYNPENDISVTYDLEKALYAYGDFPELITSGLLGHASFDSDQILSYGTYEYTWTFYPNDDLNCLTVTKRIELTAFKATPNYKVLAPNFNLYFGYHDISNLEIVNPDSLYGDLVFSETDFTIGINKIKWTFTPTDENYRQITNTVTVKILEIPYELFITSNPNKTVYTAFDTFDMTGLKLIGHYEDGSFQNLPMNEVFFKYVDENECLYGNDTYVIIDFYGTLLNLPITVNKINPKDNPEYLQQIKALWSYKSLENEDELQYIGLPRGWSYITESFELKKNHQYLVDVVFTPSDSVNYELLYAKVLVGVSPSVSIFLVISVLFAIIFVFIISIYYLKKVLIKD